MFIHKDRAMGAGYPDSDYNVIEIEGEVGIPSKRKAAWKPTPKIFASKAGSSPKKQKKGSDDSRPNVQIIETSDEPENREEGLFGPDDFTSENVDTVGGYGPPRHFQESSDSHSSTSGDSWSDCTEIEDSTRSSTPNIPPSRLPQISVVYFKTVGLAFPSDESSPWKQEPLHMIKQTTPDPPRYLSQEDKGSMKGNQCVEEVTYRESDSVPQEQACEIDRYGDSQTPRRHSVTTTTALPQLAPLNNHAGFRDEDGSSSESMSSEASQAHEASASSNVERNDELESFIKDEVLRHDPAVAHLFYIRAKGILEYAKPDGIEQFQGSHELSLLRLLELESYGVVQPSGEFVTHAPASSSGAPSSSSASISGQAAVPPLSDSTHGGSSTSKRDRATPQGRLNQQNKSEKRKSSTSQSYNSRGLRCIHNALYPAIFSVNEETREKYRTCTGPGWSSMQHVWEHMKLIHTKRLSTLQCGVCQITFPDQDELRSHTETVDCSPRCLECDEEFESKALRLEHQRSHHAENESEALFMDLDDKKWNRIKDERKEFKTYSDDLKKSRCEPKVEMENWITANITLFEAGRQEKAKARSRTELGHWYITYMALATENKIVQHPFYDYATIPHSEMAEEKILLTYDFIIESRIEAHGPPPSDPELNREWNRDVLRDTLRIAARTTRNATYTQTTNSSPESMNLSRSTQGSTSHPLQGPTSGYTFFPNNVPTVSPSPSVPNDLSDIALTPQSYLPSAHTQSMGHMTAPDMTHNWDYALNVHHSASPFQMGQSVESQLLNYYGSDNLRNPYETQGPENQFFTFNDSRNNGTQ